MDKNQDKAREQARRRLQKKKAKRAAKAQASKSVVGSKTKKSQKEYSVLSTSFTVARGLLMTFGTAFILLLVFGSAAGIGYLGRLIETTKVPDKATMVSQINNIHGVSTLKYSNGQNISDISSDLIRVKVDSNAISQNVKDALIATEDASFKSNHGVVPKAVFRAVLGTFTGGSSSGGSTITQQLIKQQILGDSVTFKRKASEIVLALALNKMLTKDQILTDYLNVSPFGRNNKGQNIAGVEEAAEGIFGKKANELTVPEAAFLAGLPQSPITYSPYMSDGTLKTKELLAYGLQRQKDVLFNMYREGVLNKSDYEKYLGEDISKEFLPSAVPDVISHGYLYHVVYSEAAEHVYDYLMSRDKLSKDQMQDPVIQKQYQDLAEQMLQTGGYTVTSTVNQNVYNAMQTAVANYGNLLQDGTGIVQPGNVLMDNKTGAVIGFVGGLDYASNQVNHAFTTTRSPGSSIKPLIAYAPAIDLGLMGSASRLSNYPTNYTGGEPIMHVGSKGTQEMMTLQDALDTSWNIPAFWAYKDVQANGGAEKYMDKMGFKVADYSIESLPMGGGIEPTVAQQTNGFQTLANGGVYQQYYTVDTIKDDSGAVIYQHKTDPVRVYSEATSTIMENLLHGPIASGKTTQFLSNLQAINPSLASSIDWTGKTGTSNDYNDAWLMLQSPAVTLGGWIGHDDNSSMGALTGYTNHGQYLANLVNAINAADPSVLGAGQKFPNPATDNNVTKSTVLSSTGEKPGSFTGGSFKNFNLSGSTTTSYWANSSGAPTTQYKFAIGGSDADYTNAWGQVLGKTQPNPTDKK